jgi:hypothetical protein
LLPYSAGPAFCLTNSGRAVGYGAPVVGSSSFVSPVAGDGHEPREQDRPTYVHSAS